MKQYNSRQELVSIGLPTYNRAYCIRVALDSLCSQTYRNIEIIISDNRSTDDTKKICLEYTRKDERIKCFFQKRPIHPIDNYNFVLNKARGKYFMWACDDDIWDKNYIEVLHRLLQKNPKAVLAVSDFLYFKKNHFYPRKINIKMKLNGVGSLTAYLANTYCHPAFIYGLFIKDVLTKIGGHNFDKRNIIGGSDFLTVFNTLLRGELMHSQKFLFKKRDSTYVVDPFAELKKLNFSKDIIYRILRHLRCSWQIFTLLDLKNCLKLVYKSDNNKRDKIFLAFYTTRYFFKYSALYFLNIFKGIVYMLVGLIIRIGFLLISLLKPIQLILLKSKK